MIFLNEEDRYGETFLDRNISLKLRDYNSNRIHEEVPILLLASDTPPSAKGGGENPLSKEEIIIATKFLTTDFSKCLRAHAHNFIATECIKPNNLSQF